MARTGRIIGQAMAGLAGPEITPLYTTLGSAEVNTVAIAIPSALVILLIIVLFIMFLLILFKKKTERNTHIGGRTHAQGIAFSRMTKQSEQDDSAL